MGDFNARVGENHDLWLRVAGHFGVGKLNENGQRLLELCCQHDLCITNRFFNTKPFHRVSWRHPRSKHWHQLDLIITRRSSLSYVQITRSYHSADCDVNHSLVSSRLRLQVKRIHCSRPKNLCISICQKSLIQIYKNDLQNQQEALKKCPTKNADETWGYTSKAIHKCAIDTFGRKIKRNSDWFDAGIETLNPVINAKRSAFLKYKRNPSEKTLTSYRKARNLAKATARHCANDYWSIPSKSIQRTLDCGNVVAMYKGIKSIWSTNI